MSSTTGPGGFQNISTLGQSMRTRNDIARVRAELLQTQTQLASGKKATTHGGLRADATVAQHLRHMVARLDGYQATMNLVQGRVSTLQSALGAAQGYAEAVSLDAFSAYAPGDFQAARAAQQNARSAFESVVGKLNTPHGGRYLFSGGMIEQPPTPSPSAILDGTGTRHGLRDVVQMRLAADMGPQNNGRVEVSYDSFSGVDITHTGGAFGLKLNRLTTSDPSGATVLQQPTAGPPPAVGAAVSFTAPATDTHRVSLEVEMPDGTIRSVTLVADNSQPTGTQVDGVPHTFTFAGGTESHHSAVAFAEAMQIALQDLVTERMTGDSAIAAGNDFFDHQVARIPDGDPATATGFAFNSGSVVSWYQGEKTVPVSTATVLHAQAPADMPPEPPELPEPGTRYLVSGTPAEFLPLPDGADPLDPPDPNPWFEHAGMIAEWDGTEWTFTEPEANVSFLDADGHLVRHDAAALADGLDPWSSRAPARGDLFLNTDDNTLMSFDGKRWISTRAEEGTRVIDAAGQMRAFTDGVWEDRGRAPRQTIARQDMQAKIDDAVYVNYGARADETGPRTTLKALGLLAVATLDPADGKPYGQIGLRAGEMLRNAADDIIGQRAELGVVQQRMTTLHESHKDYRLVLGQQVNTVEGIDDYAVATRLQDLMARLESTYTITARLSQLSLTNFL